MSKEYTAMTVPELIDELGAVQEDLNALHEDARTLKHLIELNAPAGSTILQGLEYLTRLPELRCAPKRRRPA